MKAFNTLTAALFVAAALASTVSMAQDSQAPAAAKAVKTTDLFVEGGVDRSNASPSFLTAHENDVIGMAHPSNINTDGQGYPALRE
jgi:hypothetical protein